MLRQSAVFPMQTQGPVPIESRALGTLTYIRASIESASALAVPGMAGVVMGCIGIAAAVAASVSSLATHWLQIWLAAAGSAFVLGGALMARQAALSGRTRFFGPLRKFLLCLCPALLAGAALTLALWQADLERLIPGAWLLLYGCAVLSSSTVTVAATFRLVATMGALFVALGLVALQVPASVHTALLGAGFGGLHLIFGLLIGRTSHGD
jgi:hypothetical protein